MSRKNRNALERILQDGYNESRFGSATLTELALVGTSLEVPDGAVEVCVVGVLTVSAGTGSLRLIIEGSNDNVNWHTIAQSTTSELFTTNGDVRSLGEAAGSNVSIDRWKYVRTRIVEVTSAGFTYTMAISVTAILHDSERFLDTAAFTRTGANVNSTMVTRRNGTRYLTAQVVCTAVVLGAASSIAVVLQGSPDGGTTWVDISDVTSVAGTGSQVMTQDAVNLMDLGQFQHWRLRTADVGGVATSYAISVYVGSDSCDWFCAVPVGGFEVPVVLSDMLVSVVADAPTVEALDTRTVTLRLLSMDGNPLLRQVLLHLYLSDTSGAGNADLSTNGTFSVVNTGTGITPVGSNEIVVRTAADGTCDVSVLDAAAETIYLVATGDGLAQPLRTVICQSQQVTLTYA